MTTDAPWSPQPPSLTLPGVNISRGPSIYKLIKHGTWKYYILFPTLPSQISSYQMQLSSHAKTFLWNVSNNTNKNLK